MATDRDDTDFEPRTPHLPPTTSSAELQLHGHRPFQDEPDPRPLPEANAIGGAVADIFDALIATLRDTRLEPDLEDLAVVDRQSLPPRRRPRATRARRQRGRAEAQPEGAGRLGNPLGRAGAPRGRGPHAHRTPQQHGALPRPRRRPVRTPHRLILASALGIDGQPSHADRSDDRQPRLPRRQAPRRDRGAASRLAPRSPSPAASTSTITTRSGTRSTRSTPSTPTWCCCMAAAPRAPSASPPAGPTTARSRRSSSSRTGTATPGPHRSSATTGCSTCCRSASSYDKQVVREKVNVIRTQSRDVLHIGM